MEPSVFGRFIQRKDQKKSRDNNRFISFISFRDRASKYKRQNLRKGFFRIFHAIVIHRGSRPRLVESPYFFRPDSAKRTDFVTILRANQRLWLNLIEGLGNGDLYPVSDFCVWTCLKAACCISHFSHLSRPTSLIRAASNLSSPMNRLTERMKEWKSFSKKTV